MKTALSLWVSVWLLLTMLLPSVAAVPSTPQVPPTTPPKGPDMGFWEVLVGITSLSLAGLAFLLALVSVLLYFWGRDWIVELVRRTVRQELEPSERELRGRIQGYVGFIFGKLQDVRPDFVNQAITYAQRAHETLPDDSKWKTTALNNLAFSYALRGYVTDAPAAVRYAKILLEDYATSRELEWLTTYAAIVGRFYNHFESPRQALLDAEKMMEELQQRGDVTQDQKQSAARHLETIRTALRQIGGSATQNP